VILKLGDCVRSAIKVRALFVQQRTAATAATTTTATATTLPPRISTANHDAKQCVSDAHTRHARADRPPRCKRGVSSARTSAAKPPSDVCAACIARHPAPPHNAT